MGNTSAHESLTSCLLTEQEFIALKVGSEFDHRDWEGFFCLAKVLKKNGMRVKIRYVGYGKKFDTWENYNNRTRYNFAKAGSISKRAASGPLKHLPIQSLVAYRPDPNREWQVAHIIDRFPESGHVEVAYIDSGKKARRFVHLDNRFEIDLFETLQTEKYNRKNHDNNSNRNNKNNKRNNAYLGHNQADHTHAANYNQKYQTQQQAQVQRQEQMTVRTQLLLDDTDKQLQLTRNYVDAAAQAKCSKEELSTYNQKVVVGLTCFRMKVSGMRKNGKAEGIDFDDAFKSSLMMVKKFERELRTQYGGNPLLMQRLEPCLNYMRAVLKGERDVPSLPYINEYEFNVNVASSVMSAVAHAQNHVIPNRMKEISKHNEQYKTHQKELREQYEAEKKDEEENGGDQKTEQIDYRHLIQDYKTRNIAFADSKAKQQQRNEQEQNAFKFQKPNLVDGDGHQEDYEMDMLPPNGNGHQHGDKHEDEPLDALMNGNDLV